MVNNSNNNANGAIQTTNTNGVQITSNMKAVMMQAVQVVKSSDAVREATKGQALPFMYSETAKGNAIVFYQKYNKTTTESIETGYLIERVKGATVAAVLDEEATKQSGVNKYKAVTSGGEKTFTKERKVIDKRVDELTQRIAIPFGCSDNAKLSTVVGEALTTVKAIIWPRLKGGEKIFKNSNNVDISIEVNGTVISTSLVDFNSVGIKQLLKTEKYIPTESDWNFFCSRVFQALKAASNAGGIAKVDTQVKEAVK
jgi:hypothetical protein